MIDTDGPRRWVFAAYFAAAFALTVVLAIVRHDLIFAAAAILSAYYLATLALPNRVRRLASNRASVLPAFHLVVIGSAFVITGAVAGTQIKFMALGLVAAAGVAGFTVWQQRHPSGDNQPSDQTPPLDP